VRPSIIARERFIVIKIPEVDKHPSIFHRWTVCVTGADDEAGD